MQNSFVQETIQDLDNEQWKYIPNYDNKYQVSSIGRVKSFKLGKEHILKPMLNSSGYLRVALCKDGVRHFKLVSRLVAEQFIYNDDPIHKTTIDHIDENKLNNCVSNLQWLSLADNIKKHYQKKKESSAPNKS